MFHTARAIWAHLEEMYSSHSRASYVQIKLDMATFQKGNLSMVDYFTKIRLNADQLAAAGRPMRDKDIIAAVITGLDSDYEPLITAATTRLDVMSLGEFYSHAIAFERRCEYNAARLHQHPSGSSVNFVARDKNGNNNNSRGKGRGNCGDHGGYNNNCGSDRGNCGGGGNRQQGDYCGDDRGDHGGVGDGHVHCQLCRGLGHLAWECVQRFNYAFQPQQSRMAGLAAASPPSAESRARPRFSPCNLSKSIICCRHHFFTIPTATCTGL